MYICNNIDCDYSNSKYFGLCPRCKNGIGEENNEIQNNSYKTSSKSNNIKLNKIQFNKINNEIKEDKIIKETPFKNLNRVLSTKGGFVENQIVAIAAAPGTGKSTLCVQLCDENSLYIGTEESFSQINSRFLRVNPNSNSLILDTVNIEEIISAIQQFKGNFIIIDSLNNINNGQDWYKKQSDNLVKIVYELKKNNKCGVIISQVTKSGDIVGMNTVAHTVDTVLYFERSEINNNIILYSNKNRFGEIGSVSIFKHNNNGLEEILEDEENIENEIGSIYTKARFGYKNISICVEALVAPVNGTFGQRKANGINYNRLQQIIGVLQYNSKKYNFSDKDIYVSISNGLSISDTNIDLAIAGAILSSYNRKALNYDGELIGEIGLNGKIRNSNNFKHITELISLFN